jgi:transcriptional regulator of acetoin/glycerol metabolism
VPLKEAKANLTENFEKKFLKHHYYLHNGNISIIASKVGESRESISRKIKKYGIKE